MKLSEFRFELPKKLIATHPLDNRDESRLMVVHRDSSKIEHRMFTDVLDYFDDKDVFVVNNTKVFPARLYGNKEKTGARIEVFLLRELNTRMRLWDVLVDPARKIRVGNKLYFGNDDLVAEVIDNTTSRGRTIRFLYDGSDQELRTTLFKLGQTPLPGILEREADDVDKVRYQSLFAKNYGAVAAPSASLHFSNQLIKRLQIKGIDFAEVTLHPGLGAFRNVEVEDLTKHKSESENYQVTEDACDVVNEALKSKHRVCAVGTTVMRAMESAVSAQGRLKPAEGWTDLFLFPPKKIHIGNAMITNFHLPESTLLMMATCFGGYDRVMAAYKEAIKKEYRFFAYGDAMLIV